MTTGSLGFTIPVQNLQASQEVTMTPAEVTSWRNHLPMADTGNAAKKVYHAIGDCNKVTLGLKDRFEILEILRTPAQFICQSLRKHYINQTNALTPQQLTIANLAQTIQMEMANGYKILIEQLASKPSADLEAQILPVALQRVIHYYTHIIIRCYQLYSISPKEVWRELHLIYKHADKHNLLKQNSIGDDYKRALLIAASYPYQWRQTEQDSIYKATEAWASLVTLRNDLPNVSEAGFLVIDFADDKPPMSLTRGVIQFSSSCKVLDVKPILERLNKLLKAIEPNELQARIAHANDPEYAVSTSILRGLIKEWGTPITRVHDRTVKQETIRFCTGLISTHYYLNDERPFQSPSASTSSSGASSSSTDDTLTLSLPTLGVTESLEFSTGTSGEKIASGESSSSYPLYTCTLVNETPDGYGLRWANESYPSIQPGEVMAIEKQENNKKIWEICQIRWIQHQGKNEFRLGVERLSKGNASTPKAGAAQILKEGTPVGYYLRCLIWGTSLLVPTIPFKKGSQVIVLEGNSSQPIHIELAELLDVTGSFKHFEFTNKQAIGEKSEPDSAAVIPKEPETPKKVEPDSSNNKDDFDSIWSNL